MNPYQRRLGLVLGATALLVLLVSSTAQSTVTFVQVANAVSKTVAGCDTQIPVPPLSQFLSTFTWNPNPSNDPNNHVSLRDFHVGIFRANSTTLILKEIGISLHEVYNHPFTNYSYVEYKTNKTIWQYTPTYSTWFDINASVNSFVFIRTPKLVNITVTGLIFHFDASGGIYEFSNQTHYLSGSSSRTTFAWKCND